jgi:hypothetical protein
MTPVLPISFSTSCHSGKRFFESKWLVEAEFFASVTVVNEIAEIKTTTKKAVTILYLNRDIRDIE